MPESSSLQLRKPFQMQKIKNAAAALVAPASKKASAKCKEVNLANVAPPQVSVLI